MPEVRTSMEDVTIGKRAVGPDHPPYLIAEIGSNHNGDLDLCKRMVDTAKACGADAVKFQSFSNRSLISSAEYERNTRYSDKKRHFGTLREMVDAYQFTPAMHHEVARHCRAAGIDFLSTPFSDEEVALLESVGVPAYKVASMDVNNPLLLRAIGATGKPVLLSTGMATLGEIEAALGVLAEAGAGPVVLLHCVSIYPPDPDDIHLRNIPMLRQSFGAPVGFSDHTLGTAVPLAAVALGACLVEKHFTLDTGMPGWDHAISADPAQLETLAHDLPLVWRSLGSSKRVVSEAEMEKRLRFRRRVVLRHAVPAGHVLQITDLDFKRPGTGIHPNEYPYVVGRSARRALEADHELEWEDLA
jgi:N,N'-diacetyllegionaminate synthase